MTQPRSLISLWLPYLATERVERKDPALAEAPFATYMESRGQMILAAVNPCAAGAGLTPGMSLANARALYPDITLRRADPIRTLWPTAPTLPQKGSGRSWGGTGRSGKKAEEVGVGSGERLP